MRTRSFAVGAAVAIVMAAAFSTTPLSAQSNGVNATPTTSTAPVALNSFATLRGVQALPMASSELDAVKGLHVHFLDANGGFHLAGNPENKGVGTGNWFDNGSVNNDGSVALVAPSYHGLCVAASVGRISVPNFGPSGPTPPQCH